VKEQVGVQPDGAKVSHQHRRVAGGAAGAIKEASTPFDAFRVGGAGEGLRRRERADEGDQRVEVFLSDLRVRGLVRVACKAEASPLIRYGHAELAPQRYAHEVVESCSAGLPSEPADATLDRASDAPNAVAVAIIGIGELQDLALTDRIDQAHSEEARRLTFPGGTDPCPEHPSSSDGPIRDFLVEVDVTQLVVREPQDVELNAA
jgi:hypothetical protein